MARSKQFDQAVETMVAMAAIPSLAGGAVRFEDDLGGGHWYESLHQAELQAMSLGVSVELPDYDPCTPEAARRVKCRAALAAALTYEVETLLLMIDAAERGPDGDPGLYRRALAVAEEALAPRAELVELRPDGAG